MEMTWVGMQETGGRHQEVPRELLEEAERLAKKAVEGEEEEEEEEKEKMEE